MGIVAVGIILILIVLSPLFVIGNMTLDALEGGILPVILRLVFNLGIIGLVVYTTIEILA